MKKSLIALAVLAASGAAMAQSSVTMYGILDIGYSKTDLATAAAGVKVGQNNGGGAAGFHTPSRFGLRGSEDLGGGMKANFDLQTGGLAMDTGAATGINFTREAWAGLSGNFGSTRIGLTSSFGTQSQVGFDLNGISTTSAMVSVGISPVTWYGSSRRSSQFQYQTPNMGGFVAGLAYVAPGDNANKSTTQVHVNYANGPLAAGLVAESARTAANRTAYALAASYNFGVAKVSAGYVVSETEAVTYSATNGNNQGGKGAHIGVSAPFGAVTVGAQYARNTESKDSAVELFANYALSKRSSLYFDAGRVSRDAGIDITRYGVGILHSF